MILGSIRYLGKDYITSKKFHEEVQPTSGVFETNRAIRDMPTYPALVEGAHILEVDNSYTKAVGDADLASLVKSNSYRPIMLIDPVAQKEIEHHFEVSSTRAVHSSKENAVLSMAGINLQALSRDPQVMLLLKMMSDQAELREIQARQDVALKQLSIDSKKNTFTSEQLQEINSALDSKYHEYNKVGWVLGKIRRGLKEKFLTPPIGSMTWKDIASEHFDEVLEYVLNWSTGDE